MSNEELLHALFKNIASSESVDISCQVKEANDWECIVTIEGSSISVYETIHTPPLNRDQYCEYVILSLAEDGIRELVDGFKNQR